MEIILSIITGVGLAATVGLKMFLPLYIISGAALFGNVELVAGVEWLGTYPAFIAFGVATIIEILVYYVPYLDNLLDVVGTPIAILLGMFVMFINIGEMEGMLRWVIVIMGGGVTTGFVHIGKTAIRGISTATTGGLGNAFVTTVETVIALVLAVLSVLLPIVALVICMVVFSSMLGGEIEKRKKQKN